MLRFAEEVALLLLHDDLGNVSGLSDWSTRYAFGGSVLMDLALENRIDTDLESLILIDSTPVNDRILDPMLAEIAQESETHHTRYWIERAASQENQIRHAALDRLVERGMLQRHTQRILWVFRRQRLNIVDEEAARQVEQRIRDLLFSDDLPGPRDVVTICLADVCGILDHLLSASELEQAAARISQFRQMDLIGQAITQAIWDIESSLVSLVQMQMH